MLIQAPGTGDTLLQRISLSDSNMETNFLVLKFFFG